MYLFFAPRGQAAARREKNPNTLLFCLFRVKLSRNQLDPAGNRVSGWGVGEKRGNKPYDPPIGWIGFGLKVIDYYMDNTWLGKNNCQGEWPVAYNGVARDRSPEEVTKIIGLIIKNGFRASIWGKAENDEDLRHPGKKCGHGVYCTPDINYAEDYAGIVELNGE